MTAAHRFRGWGWLLTCVIVALGCYMVSLQVAAERRQLDQAAGAVRQAREDIRRLETEFDARASMAQLEKWNGDSFRYAAPTAGQFVGSAAQLAALDPAERTGGATLQLAAAVVPSATAISATAIAPDAPRPIVPLPKPAVAAVGVHPAAGAKKAPDGTAPIGRVIVAAVSPVSVRGMERRPQLAMLDRKLLSDATLGDLKVSARLEGRGR